MPFFFFLLHHPTRVELFTTPFRDCWESEVVSRDGTEFPLQCPGGVLASQRSAGVTSAFNYLWEGSMASGGTKLFLPLLNQ